MTELQNLISLVQSTFVGVSIDSAKPSKHFAFPPYRLEPMHPNHPEGLQCIMNANGSNCLTFEDSPGAVFAPKPIARAIVDKWNKERQAKMGENTKGRSAVVPDFTEANEEASKQIQSINRAIGVGQRKVTGDVINRKLIYPHKENT